MPNQPSAAHSPARPSSLIDLVRVTAQVSVETQPLIDALGFLHHQQTGELDTFSLSVRKRELVMRLFTWGVPSNVGPARRLQCVGRLPGVIEGDAVNLEEMRHAEFYDRSTALTLCLADESLYLGKYWLPVRFPPILLSPTSPEEERRQIIMARVAEIDAISATSPPTSRSELAQRYERDDVLIRLIKELRGSACQVCGASFVIKSGDSYCEVHHLEHLAHLGLNVSSNLLVLCAQHHRQFHFGEVRIREHTSAFIVVEVDGALHECIL